MKPRDENKIDQIYQATLKQVKANGLAGITMQSVAREANIATGTLYIYFKNKEALILSLYHVCVKNSAGVYFKNYDPKAPFKVSFYLIWSNMVQHRISSFTESIFMEQCYHSPFIDEDTRKTLKKMFEPLMNLIKRGKEERLIKDIDTFWLIAFLIGTVNEIAKRTIYFNKKLTTEILNTNFQMCWDGIKA
ncbi:TetR/AcrR family transcriptional regulator [Chitinophagaceae bacterium LB-8]|uniref:TetR/AcrR family transcriptional regulator n=1 Tax=Paraflavisolibacter caeni TaxID=2982496 RepID=A0A9X2Y002_9BACT|nr:TetR/AcrR family transcriptional regulator [Paraflavisolibacter caeni]MCU7552799.1 TetR/AcrR family transcriptional regulator [Paraflavisolibacter caeni]